MLAFEHLYDRDEAQFIRRYVESSAGLWEMLWPVALVADARERSFLEVGCGYGFTVDWWHRCMNTDAIGCDPAIYAAIGREQLGSHIHNALLADVPEARDRQFDMIYASEVIEHVDNPVAFVRELAARLTPRGILTLTTPAAEFVAPEHTDSIVVAALAPGFHGVLFSEQQLSLLLREAGFACVVTRRYNERLVCWCSAVPINFLPGADSSLPSYLGYLADIVNRPHSEDSADAQKEAQGTSLRAGAAYRLYKEYALRGQRDKAQQSRQAAHRDLLLTHWPDISLESAVDAFLGTADGSFASFLKGARLYLPQLCFVDGHLAEQDGDFQAATRWYRRCTRAMRWIAGSSRLGNVEGSAFVWSATAGLARCLVASKQFDELGDVAITVARSVVTRDSPYASIPEPAVATNCLLQILTALDRNGDARFQPLLELLQAENCPTHPLLTAVLAIARALHARDAAGDQALASRIAEDARKILDQQGNTVAGRWLGADTTTGLQHALSQFVMRPASFSALFGR